MKINKNKCMVCSGKTSSYLYICEDCLGLLDRAENEIKKDFQYIDKAYACYKYVGVMEELIKKFKFSNKRYLADLFGEILCDKIIELGLHREADLMVAVPIHEETRRLRGYNHIELLIDYIKKNLKIHEERDNLVKIKKTQEQARLSGGKRISNLDGAFLVKNPAPFESRNILIIDDMITTGTTVEKCGQILREAGAQKVIALSLASL